VIKVVYLACGGAVGTMLRYYVAGVIFKAEKGTLPWGTIVVNVVGCFLIGTLWALLERIQLSENVRAFLFIGFLGAFTTFSTYNLENFSLLRHGAMRLAFINMGLSNGLGLLAVAGGFFLMRGISNA